MRIRGLRTLTRAILFCPIIFGGISVGAQPPRISQIKARLFFQISGEFSAPLNEKEILWNVVAGGGDMGPASSAFIDVVVSGAAEKFFPKRVVDLLIKNKQTGSVIERQVAPIGIFSSSGETHVGFWLRSVGCESLILVASTGDSVASLGMPFHCGE